MSEIVVEAGPEARDQLEAFRAQHPDVATLERSRGFDGGTTEVLTVLIKNLPAILTSLAALVTALRARGHKVRVEQDGKDITESLGAGKA